MPRTVNIPDDAARVLDAALSAGRFPDASAAVTAAFAALAEQERDAEKLAALRAAIDDGDASGVYEGDPFAAVRARHGLPPVAPT